MKRFFEGLCMAVALAVVLFLAPSAATAAKSGFSAAELQKMGTFLSNFTELGYYDFTLEKFTDEKDPAAMIRFGIWHNYGNSYHTRIGECPVKDCERGGLVIDGKYVKESVKKYFDYDIKKLVTVSYHGDRPYYYDGKQYHFDGADGEAVWHARVDDAAKNASGRIVMRGEIYNADDEGDKMGAFEAVAKPHTWAGKNTWAILSMKMTKYYEPYEPEEDDSNDADEPGGNH